MIKRLGLRGMFYFALLFAFAGEASAQESLTLLIHPYLSAPELIQRFTPLAERLEKRSGEKIRIEISRDYSDHIQRTGENLADISFLGPVPYIEIVQQYGPRRILGRIENNGSPFFRGVIIVPEDSPLQNLSDLKGKRFAFADPRSTMGYWLPRFLMMEEGVLLDGLGEFVFLRNHYNVALGVLMGEFDAGAVKEEVFAVYRDRGLKALVWTPPVSEHLIVVSDKVSQETVDALKDELLHLNATAEGRSVLQAIKETLTGFVPAANEDYDNLRDIMRALSPADIAR